MPKRKRGITGDAASRREAIRKRERRVAETDEERNRRLSTMAQRGQKRRAEETEEQRNSRLACNGTTAREEPKKQTNKETADQGNGTTWPESRRNKQQCVTERSYIRAEETEEQRNSRLAVMAQRGQRRRAEETDEQRNSRLAVMGQRGQERKAEGTDEQRNSRLSAMVQHAIERRLNVIEGQNQHPKQTFYAARTVLN
ncbi:hypothetical protein AVEN_221152-1 [Araneus ventricosus]|uniref:STPR domain-containing protein n=1 Tax=Araneus ventricosus TaxID=182803 RepID=A0A4Y2TZ04_ARAVE|nr:hypothetical protein AVEN_221152-1 [Araneus ventricosus]